MSHPMTAAQFVGHVKTPLGRIALTSDGQNITGLAIERHGQLPWGDDSDATVAVLETAKTQLLEYFAGSRKAFDLPIEVAGTAFQKAVWEELNLLPFGAVASYADIGRATGRESAARAVGGAIGANPVPIIVPCHRVLGSNKTITGYSAGDGISTKAWLLDHEGIEHRA